LKILHLILNKIQSFADDTAANWLPSIEALGKMNKYLGNYTRRVIVMAADAGINRTVEQEKNLADTEKFRQDLDNEIKKYLSLISPGEQEYYDRVKAAYENMDKLLQEQIELIKQGKGKESILFNSEQARGAVFKLSDEIEKEIEFNAKGATDSSRKGTSLTSLTSTAMTIVITLSFVLAIFVFKIILGLTKDIAHSIEELKRQGEGTMKVSGVLKQNSQALSESVTEQAASVHETTAAINEITSMINKTSENAQESTKVAKNASSKAEESQKTMAKLVSSMETIQESNNQLQNIAEIINQIHAKTSVINDIVSKTELLSLNASIESARAGEYGKGFAVVAEEVGNLAKISGKSAHEIQELITKSQEEVLKILNITKERVAEGKKVTAEAQNSFVQISEDIVSMVSVIDQISAATKEQDVGVRQITTAMSEIDRATQNNQASVNSTAQSSNELVEQGEKLTATTKEIESLIMGDNPAGKKEAA